MRPPYLANSVFLLSLLFPFTQPLFSQSGSGSNDGVTYKYEYEQMGTCPVGSPEGTQEPIYEWNYYDIDVSEGGGSNNANATTAYIVSPGGTYCPPNGPTATLQIPVTGTGSWAYTKYLVNITAETGGDVSVVIQGTQEYFPNYKLVSLLYPPPGNESYQGYVTGTTTGTTTTIGTSFSDSTELEASVNIPIINLTAGGSWGWTTTTSNSQALSNTWTEATTYQTSETGLNTTNSNMIDHNWDTFLIWLNTEVIVTGTTEPADWEVISAPITGVSGEEAEVIGVVAQGMEANSSGDSTVPISQLEPVEYANGSTQSFLPGLASICKSQTLYQEQLAYDIANPTKANEGQYCTQANQCGCTPADFLPILEMDALLNIDPSTYQPYASTPTGYVGTTDPVTLDKSGTTTCSENPIPEGSDCRYVVIAQAGGTSPIYETLNVNDPVNYTQTDQGVLALTTGSSYGQNTSLSIGGGFFFTLKVTDTWSWTDSESTTSSSGTSNSMQLQLKTTTAGCSEPVSIYEDTLYHTFVFQVPDDWQTVCP